MLRRTRVIARSMQRLSDENKNQAKFIEELKDSLRTVSGFYGSDLREEGIDPMTCPNYRKARELIEKEL